MTSNKVNKTADNTRTGGKTPLRLNLRNLPTEVTGFPEILFTKYILEIQVTGPKTVRRILREKTPEGLPGKFVELDDALRLCRSPGFVKGCDKEEVKSIATEKTRLFFAQTDFDAKLTKDPKAFVKIALDYEANLNASRAAVKRAEEDTSSKHACDFFSDILDRAKDTLDLFMENRKEGKMTSLKELATGCGLPHSMISKTLTGSVVVPPNGKFWSTLIGRDPQKFCPLTLKEITIFEDKHLVNLLDRRDVVEIRLLAEPKAMALAMAVPIKGLTAKMKEKYLSNTFPIRPPATRLALLIRAEQTGSSVRFRVKSNSLYPILTEKENCMLERFHTVPPTSVSEIRPFWQNLTSVALMTPELASIGYRRQVIDAWIESGAPEFKPPLPYQLKWEVYRYNGAPIETLCQLMLAPNIASEKIDQYQPIEIVGIPKRRTKKDRARAAAIRKNELSPVSEKFFKGLRREGVPQSIQQEVLSYLESFSYIKMQELAAKVVYLTCQLQTNEAKKQYLAEESVEDYSDHDEDHKESASDGADDDDNLPEVDQPETSY